MGLGGFLEDVGRQEHDDLVDRERHGCQLVTHEAGDGRGFLDDAVRGLLVHADDRISRGYARGARASLALPRYP